MIPCLRFPANVKLTVSSGSAFIRGAASFGKCVAILVHTVVVLLVFSGALTTASAQGCPGNDLVPQGGLGTSSSPYRIATPCQLQGISSPSHYIQIADIDASLTRSWYANKGFAPIGATYSTAGLRLDSPGFSGTFDGGGYRISNLFINRPGEDYVGLFSRLLSGTLRAVALRDSHTTGRDWVGSLAGEVGSLAGESFSGMIGDSYALAKVSGRDRVGGLVGEHTYKARNRPDDHFFNGNYVVGTVVGRDHVGGLVGDSRSDSSHSMLTLRIVLQRAR